MASNVPATDFIHSFKQELLESGVSEDLVDGALARTIAKTGINIFPPRSPSPLRKNARTSAVASAPVSGSDGHVTLTGDEAVKFVNAKLESGEWKKVEATVVRDNGPAFHDQPLRKYTFEFIIDNKSRSTYDHKETIKAAGYTHYSASNRYGWNPVKLPGDVKGFGMKKQQNFSDS